MGGHKKDQKGSGVKGFSLVEILVVFIIMGIVLTAVYGLFRSQQTAYVNQDQVVAMRQNVRAAVDMMSQEIRQAGLCSNANRPTNPVFGIVQATGTFLQLTSDLNMNGALSTGGGALEANETITYQFVQDNLVLTRDAGRPANGANPVDPQRIADNLRLNPNNAPQFVYFMIADGSFRGITANIPSASYATSDPVNDPNLVGGNLQDRLDAIRRIRVTLSGQTSRPDQSGQFRNYTLNTDIGLRNMNYIKN